MLKTISSRTLAELAQLDTCDVANAIESFSVRLRNEGYTNSSIQCRFPTFPPMVGYAVTMRIRTSAPSPKTRSYVDRTDWWSQLSAMPFPHVLVVQDLDHDQVGAGAFIGEIHAAILKALGCVGIVTNGAIRDLPGIQKLGLQSYSEDLSPSHAYAHVVDVGAEVAVAGLVVRPGDLLHGDQHGIIRIPHELSEQIAPAVRERHRLEQEILEFCQSPDFSIPALQDLIGTRREGPEANSEAAR